MLGWLRRRLFKKAVRGWCIQIRLHRELSKAIYKLSGELEATSNRFDSALCVYMLEMYLDEYRKLDDLLRAVALGRLSRKLRGARP